tara:strand:+ start:350 stop:760 length:411 start_codon:yes stop_codon:yes gene_type:complete
MSIKKLKPTQKQIEEADLITLAAISCELALWYVERLKDLGVKHFKRNLKNTGNKFITELIKTELDVYDKLYDIEEDIITTQTDSVQDGLTYFKQVGFVGFVLTNRFNRAYNANPKKVMDVIDEILLEDDATRRNSK